MLGIGGGDRIDRALRKEVERIDGAHPSKGLGVVSRFSCVELRMFGQMRTRVVGGRMMVKWGQGPMDQGTRRMTADRFG